MRDFTTKPILCYCAILLFSFTAYSQKLPKVQEVSIPAPGNVKVDGNLDEWGALQAYNNKTDIFYTMANGGAQLYLAVQVVNMEIINKIIAGGITLTLQQSADKKEQKNKASFTYPVTDAKSTLTLSPYALVNLRGRLVKDTSAKAADSLRKRQNSQISTYCKWIGVNGVEGIDTLISIYNTDGIKAVGQVDSKEAYAIEFAMPLKYLKFLTAGNRKLYYNIRVNGIKNTHMYDLAGTAPASVIQLVNEKVARLTAPTDFWGEYTLAK